MTLPLLAVGGDGVISVSANIVPKDMRALVHSYLEGNRDEALRLHREMSELNTALFLETNPIPVKTAVNMLSQSAGYGLPHCGNFRLPMTEMSPANQEALKKALKDYGLPV